MKKYFKKTIILLLVAFMLCGCGKENPPEDDDNNSTNYTDNSDRISDEIPQPIEKIADSEAFSFSPYQGITISAEEDALYSDTVIDCYPVEYDEETEQYICDFFAKNNEFYPLAAFEIDAGLGPEEYFPLGYTVEIDLAEYDIDPALYDTLTAYRIDDDGYFYEYITEVKDGKLVFSSDQNSIVLVGSLVLGGLVIYAYETERNEIEEYYTLGGNSYMAKDYVAYGNKYRLIYSPSDLGVYYTRKVEKYMNLYQKLKAEAKQEYEEQCEVNKWSMFGFMRNKTEAVILQEKVKANKELNDLLKEIEDPPALEIYKSRITTSFYYLRHVAKVKMPLCCVDFYLRGGMEDLGNEVDGTIRSSYIILKANEMAFWEVRPPEEKTKDDLLLTITHELFHICERRYHVGAWDLTNNVKFDEMLAVTLEADAYKYYKEKKYIETDPELTEAKFLEDLKLPINNDASLGDRDTNNNVHKHEGYILARFIMYLREKTGKNVTVKEIIDKRFYLWNISIGGPLMSAFGIKETEFETHWRGFCVSMRKNIDARYRSAYPNFEMPQDEMIQLSANGKVKVVNNNKEDYHAEIRAFKKVEQAESAFLIVLDPNWGNLHAETTVVPLDKYTKTKNGAFIKDEEYFMDSYQTILEVYGKASSKGDSFYYLYSLNPLAKASVQQDSKNLSISITDKSEAGKDGQMEGYCVWIQCSDGTNKDYYYSYEDAQKTIKIPLTDLCSDAKNAANLTYSVCYGEYITDTGGNKMVAPLSEYASSGTNDSLCWALTKLVYKERVDVGKVEYDNNETCIGPDGKEQPCLIVSEEAYSVDTKCDDGKCYYHREIYYSTGTSVEEATTNIGKKIYLSSQELFEFLDEESASGGGYISLYSNKKDLFMFYPGITSANQTRFDEKAPKLKEGSQIEVDYGGVTRIYEVMTVTQAQSITVQHVESY